MEESPPCSESLTGNLDELLADSDNDAGQFCFKEEMIEEVMQELYKEIACPKPPSPSPTLTSLSLSLSEPSPSHSPNTKVEMPETENGSLLTELQHGSDEFVELEVGQENKMEGCQYEGDFDDEWLARVLCCAQGNGQVVDTSEWF